jgi:Zn-dependent protease/CBS domain-containing protein
MRWSWKLGELFGIGIYIHATFLILLVWVALSHLLEGHGPAAMANGVLLILAVFGVVVLHELAHALTARRFGIRTRDITLLPIGGVSTLERMPEKPTQELLVAMVGPALNLVIAFGLYVLISLVGGPVGAQHMHMVGGPFLTKLMWINLSLGIFNLIPAFPMDGGRVLRAALALRMEYTRATEVAARLGQGIALLFGMLGLFFNPILLFIALFVWMGAQQEASLAQLRTTLAGIPIGSAMITDFKVLSPKESLSKVAELIIAGFQHDFPIVEDDQVVGVLNRADVIRGLAQSGGGTPIEEVMQRKFVAVEPSEMLESAFNQMRERQVASVLVLKDGRILGIVTPENIGELVMMQSALRGVREKTPHRWATSSSPATDGGRPM